MPTLTIPQTGGTITVTSNAEPANPNLTYGSLPPYTSISGDVITLSANTSYDRDFTLSVTSTTVSNPAYQGTATAFSAWTVSQSGALGPMPSNMVYLQWVTGQFQNNTQNYAGVVTSDSYVTCSDEGEGTSFTTKGTIGPSSTGNLYVSADTRYEVPLSSVSFTIDGFPDNIVPIQYDNCYITITFSQGDTTRSISYSTTNPNLLTQTVDLSVFSSTSDVNVYMTINFVKT